MKSLTESLFRPEPGFECGPRGLLVLTAPDFQFFRDRLAFPYRRSLFLSQVLFGEKGALCGPALGAPQAVMLLENLVAAGGREFLVLGWAGTLAPERLPLGGLFLPQRAYSLEGTSRHYLPRKKVFRPAPLMLQRVRGLLQAFGLYPFSGAVVSTDAPYREDQAFFKRWSPKAQAVDMETSALLAAAEALGVKLAVLLLLSDALGPRGRKKIPASQLKPLRQRLLPALEAYFD
ncbi:nucleoside phosphorylase [Thermosulfurimonas marina]|uniref:Nucleoside phosphorylase n=1 Tax=Thermosulfurimonas marina TaxID=2047767 RepID=A0A6H1WQE0_9BACT|nr:nucleoside phosphorylase [Thermosulfurimonas marina]QJA05437.1 nucleoside phosphorylase [Thermosulfurimonas marina]